MTDQKPTGVFVRLPLSGAEKMALTSGVKMGGDIEAGIAAIGSPVMGGELEISGYIPEKPCLTKRDGTNASTFEDREDRRHTIPLVRQSDAQAQIAARDAEIVRLREENEALKELAKAGRDYLKYCSAVVKGGAA